MAPWKSPPCSWTIFQSAASDLSLLEAVAREAGALTRTLLQKPLDVRQKGAAGPVTNVDLAVDKLLAERLRTARPDYGWLSEESFDDTAARRKCERAFIVDPIDGTAALVSKLPEFTISIGIADNGRAFAGCVYNPMTDEMFLGAPGHGASFNGAPMHASTRETLEGARMIGQARNFADQRWPTPWPRLDVIARQSIAYRLALVACGRADGVLLIGGKNEWDIAAGLALVEAAGGRASDPWDGELELNRHVPRAPGVVAAGAKLHPLLIERTTHLPRPG